MTATRYDYWPSKEPAEHQKSLLIKPFMPPNDMSYPQPTMAALKAFYEANGWEKDVPGCVILGQSDWRSQPSYYQLREPDTEAGTVTIQGTADFIVSGMKNIERGLGWWSAYLTHTKNLGYSFGNVAMDWEAKFTRGWKYAYAGHTAFTMLDVVEFMAGDPAYACYVPHDLVLADFLEDNVYGVPKNERAMVIWSRYISKMLSDKLREVYYELTTKMFWPDCFFSNYDYVDTLPGCPLLSKPHGLEHVQPAVKNSAPLLYLSPDTNYATNEDAKQAFASVADPSKCTPWVGNPTRTAEATAGKWHQSQDQFDELNTWLELQGVRSIMVF